ncbi:TetR family transcriptional regulator [Amnibacterium setariae]|uniref:TetR/AcrR family transcriptional regulator n=1 Tax=Amnibacterium setariae TaxID=2306585 RepID=A0A3A1TWF9_9MICO|nr:TetR family transcriptional regulator [Amnibacterium setariae]RIX28573.1 TetR/AcrR family transcriptional regulator [Amnibacterium setariae]
MTRYDRAETTARIFRAAVQEFAEHGIAGARVDRIAADADAGKALIYTYFGDKEALFAAVLRSRMTELAEAVVLRPDRVGEFVGDLFDFMTANPDVLRLVSQEALHLPPDAVPDFAERRDHYAGKTRAVAEAQAAGLVDPALEPSFVVLSLMGLVSWFVAAPQITRLVLDEPDGADLRRRYRQHLVEVARRMLTPGG